MPYEQFYKLLLPERPLEMLIGSGFSSWGCVLVDLEYRCSSAPTDTRYCPDLNSCPSLISATLQFFLTKENLKELLDPN